MDPEAGKPKIKRREWRSELTELELEAERE